MFLPFDSGIAGEEKPNCLTKGIVYDTLISMRWVVEYYGQADTTQPAEEFEDSLKRHHKKLGAKSRAIAAAIEVYGPQLGGGLIEPCHDHKGGVGDTHDL